MTISRIPIEDFSYDFDKFPLTKEIDDKQDRKDKVVYYTTDELGIVCIAVVRELSNMAYISSFETRKERRKNGIGGYMLECLKTLYRVIQLCPRKPAKNFYKEHRFKPIDKSYMEYSND